MVALRKVPIILRSRANPNRFLTALIFVLAMPLSALAAPRTAVTIRGDAFYLNGQPTYAGHSWQGHSIEGLLFNARLVQGIWDDLNSDTVANWAYPDTHRWDPDRNTSEFIAAMPDWRRHGLLAFTLNLQGGSPYGYSKAGQPWENSAFASDGSLRPAYMARLTRILDRADSLGMVVILGYFYVAQERRFTDEAAVLRASDNATRWLLSHNYRNVLVEIANESGTRFQQHAILHPDRIAELITRTRAITLHGRRLLVGTSFGGGVLPPASVVVASDFVLIHGNGISDPAKIAQMVRDTRAIPGYTPRPILFNEDDHFAFDQPLNNMTAALAEHASWGYFDYRMAGEGPADGFQSVPVDWTIDSPRKIAFFHVLAEITGSTP
jgi:hypothetical protein